MFILEVTKIIFLRKFVSTINIVNDNKNVYYIFLYPLFPLLHADKIIHTYTHLHNGLSMFFFVKLETHQKFTITTSHKLSKRLWQEQK